MQTKWSNRFEIKPDRWVFEPTAQSRARGLELQAYLQKRWTAPSYYYHLRKGGHIAAIRTHLAHAHFLHLDIHDFFGSINRTRVTRNLKTLIGYARARQWANDSTVSHPKASALRILPYGFVQSVLLASLCLRNSALGQCLHKFSSERQFGVSVYVDDIILSSDFPSALSAIHDEVSVAARKSSFAIQPAAIANTVNAFNIEISKSCMRVTQERLQAFEDVARTNATVEQKRGILAYVGTVNSAQAIHLREMFAN